MTSPITLWLLVVSFTWWDGRAGAFEDPDAVIEQKCARDWPDNPRMRAACIEQQGTILDKSLSSTVDPRLPPEDLTLLREKCARDWPEDFRQRAQCEQQQIRGFQRLQAPPPRWISLKDYSVTMASCASDWPDDFRMRARCLEEQFAERRLQRDNSGAMNGEQGPGGGLP